MNCPEIVMFSDIASRAGVRGTLLILGVESRLMKER